MRHLTVLLALGVTGGLCRSLTTRRVQHRAPGVIHHSCHGTPFIPHQPLLRVSIPARTGVQNSRLTMPYSNTHGPNDARLSRESRTLGNTGINSRTMQHPFVFGIYSTRESGIRQCKGVGVEPKGDHGNFCSSGAVCLLMRCTVCPWAV